ncbi:MBL fold metallo-hydrolase [Bacillus sp. FJAT-49711]|uniref:MBL fold metallo-hydrolase n=1 Tax=Bacillus sp. FJAT-49711 TaxID=2833585 RepID=UPI001BC9AA82|nr:MBL fold metallo-hydrolase [Bacillus sp. FJAT-49711]MBS4217987.1 MBL fold metallo-hydrolase [Bacillus sp. FJAT-49711]
MLTKISDTCFYIKGHVNIGYATIDGKGLLIDSGLDKGAAKKIIKILKQHDLPINFCIITHGHVDHYGGAAYLQREWGVKLFASKIESAFVQNPILEPIYLWNGAMPIGELRNKFLEGEEAHINNILNEGIQTMGPFLFEVLPFPGHSYGQIGIIFDGVLYAGDSYFGRKVLDKHKVPFIVDAKATINTLEKISFISCHGAIPGHGDFEVEFQKTIVENIKCHEDIKSFLLTSLKNAKNGISMDDLQTQLFLQYELTPANIGSWLLYRTSYTAYISSLIEDGFVSVSIKDQKLFLNFEQN